ncbi:MAG: ribosome maturation factor RimM [Pseudomonadota bacterium]|nr:ribosome maturation factor RimM [Pseudomonadota bacterium]
MDEVVLGEVNGVFGVHGEVRVMLHHREGETLFTARTVTLVSPAGVRKDVNVVARPGAGKRVLVRIEGVTTPEAAAGLMGWAIVVDRAVLPPPAEGEFYIHDLIDLPVFDEAGAALGKVSDVVAGQERDVWVIETDAGQAFVVASPENVRSVDVPGRRVVLAVGALSPGE